jgi:transcription-repair coupling factor (superfamily II helicase)
LTHGIGRYRGLDLLEKDGRVEEYLKIEFHGGTKVYVPASKIGLVQKYVGGSKTRPALAKIGNKTWVRQKQAAEAAVVDLAAEMLQIQAERQSRPGIAFAVESDWQREFEASFPYQRDARPTDRTGLDPPGHAAFATDGPAAVRRRRVRQDRIGDAGLVPGRR